jgi:hypothetical protein
MRKMVPPIALFFLAPLVAEFLLGNLPISALGTLVLLAPLYGGGAVLVRELARRTSRGWPAIGVLALAYGVLEEGIVTMSLFNPNYAGQRLLDNGYIPQLGIGAPWTATVLTLHVIWSICVPVALIEVLARPRGSQPWLGRVGLAVFSLLFILGVVGTTWLTAFQEQFVASGPQLVASAVIVVLLVVLACNLPRPASRVTSVDGRAPSPWVVGVLALALTSAFKMAPHTWPPVLLVGIVLALAVIAVVGIAVWSRRAGWGDAHKLALAGGALLTYAWTAFPQDPVLPADPTVDLVGNAVFALGAVALLIAAAIRIRSTPTSAIETRASETSRHAA